jgi:hypothetical protein
MKAVVIIAVGAVSLLGVTSCSSEKKLDVSSAQSSPEESIPSDVSIPDITIPSNITIPDITDLTIPSDISIPDGAIPQLSGDCGEYLQIFASVFAGGDQETFDGLADVYKQLKDSVPEELKDDVDKASEGLDKLAALYKEYNYDAVKVFQDPEAQALITDQDFNTALTNVSNWLEEECKLGG